MLRKFYNSILCYLATGTRWVRSKFQKNVAPTDGKAVFEQKKKQISKSGAEGDDPYYGIPEDAFIQGITKEGNVLFRIDRGWYKIVGVKKNISSI